MRTDSTPITDHLAAWLTKELGTVVVFNPASGPFSEDDEYEVVGRGFGIQCCEVGGGYAVNEYGGDSDNFWMKSHGIYQTPRQAAAKLKSLLI